MVHFTVIFPNTLAYLKPEETCGLVPFTGADPLMRDTPWLAGLYAHGVRANDCVASLELAIIS